MPRLVEHFGSSQIYRDLDTNRPGFDFTEQMEEALDASAVVLVLIGLRWLTAADKAGHRRLENPDDFTRREVEHALTGHQCVIPVLVDSGEMPTSNELPESLRSLANRHAFHLRSTDWNYDVERLVEHLERNGVRPALTEEHLGEQGAVPRHGKIYEREYVSSPARAYEILSATLRALHYPVIAEYPERSEIRFLWGSKEKAAGRAIAALYRRMEPSGVRATVRVAGPGHAKIVIETPSVQRYTGATSMIPMLGITAKSIVLGITQSITMLEQKVVRDFLEQVQGLLIGDGIQKDPAAAFDNLVRWMKRQRTDP